MAARPRLRPLGTLLVERGLAADAAQAEALIAAGEVLVDGLPASSPRARVRVDRPVRLRPTGTQWVSRGAHKLLGALEDLPMRVAGHDVVDLGSSTGGFTQVLLERGARRVFAVDVGRGLLHRSLETDPRVVVMEGVNARELRSLPGPVDRVVGDLSFISLRLILPTLAALLPAEGEALILVKPQFEAPRGDVGPGGLVDGAVREAAIDAVVREIDGAFRLVDQADCRLEGARARNTEHFLWLRRR